MLYFYSVSHALPCFFFFNVDRYWKAITDHNINQLYVTPFVITQLMRDSNSDDLKKGFPSLKTIATGTVINDNHTVDP